MCLEVGLPSIPLFIEVRTVGACFAVLLFGYLICIDYLSLIGDFIVCISRFD